MKEIKFTLYSVLKNEDAIPYIGQNLLVVADGLGGSGSALHYIDKDKFYDMEDGFYHSAFADFKLEHIKELKLYLNQSLEEMIDEKNDTSALWASRIVSARYIYALNYLKEYQRVDNANTREELVKFIQKGLTKTKNQFQLSNGKYKNQLLLPTTLASLRYTTVNNKINVEALWAGDSRCYALSKEGLFQLSMDDEDASGAITNLFYEGNLNTKLNYKKYELPQPCILFVVSDGFFDPFETYENLGLESLLFDCLNKSTTLEEFKLNLISKPNQIHADDATIAFTAIGFKDFSTMKNHFQSRSKEIFKMQKDYLKYQDFLYMQQQSDSEYLDYMKNRTKDKYLTIKEIVTTSLLENKPYSFQFLKNAFEEIKSQSKENCLKQYQTNLIEQIETDFKKRILPPFKQNIQTKDIHKIEENNFNYQKCKEKEKIIQSKISLLETQKENLLTSYYNFKKEVNLQSEFFDLKEIVKKIEVKIKIDYEIHRKSLFNQLKTIQSNLNLLQKVYKKQVKKLIQKYKINFNLVKRDILLNKYNLKKESLDFSVIKNNFYLYLENNQISVIQGLLEQMKEKETIIDHLYNSTRLKYYRLYFKYQKNPSKNFLKFNNKLKQFNIEYMKHLN